MLKKKIIIILVLISIIILIFTNTCNAGYLSNIIKDADNFVTNGKKNAQIDGVNTKLVSDMIFSALITLGLVLSVIVGGVIGIKFMISSADDKAKVKESMAPYVLGCFIIFGAAGIWKICIMIFGKMA